MMTQNIESVFDEVISMPRWDIFSDKTLTIAENSLIPIYANIRIESWDINMFVDKNIEFLCKSAIKKCNLSGIYKEPLMDLIFSVFLHEIGHWKICPFDRYYFEDILSGCYDGLQESGYFHSIDTSDKKERNNLLFALRESMGTFEDLIVNSATAGADHEREKYKRGMALYPILGVKKEDISGFDCLFFNTNALLSYYDDKLYNATTSFFKVLNKNMENTMENIVKTLVVKNDLADKIIKKNIDDNEKASVARLLADPRDDSWYKKSKKYAKLIAPYLKENLDKLRQPMPGSQYIQILFGPPVGIEGQGIQTNQEGQQGNQQTQDSDNNGEEGKDSDKAGQKGKDKNGKKQGKAKGKGGEGSEQEKEKETELDADKKLEEIIKKIRKERSERDSQKEAGSESSNYEKQDDLYENINKEFLKEMVGIGIQKGREINYADRFNLLDVLYKGRAEEIVVKIVTHDKNSLTTRLTDLTREEVTSDNIDLKRIQWGRTRVYHTQRGEKIKLYKGDIPLDIDDPAIPSNKSIPDIALIIDSSGSMESDIIRGDEGPYDLLLRAQYSLFNWLEKTGKGYQMNFAIVNFSGDTFFSGWKPYEEFDEVKKELFKFQNGGTVLDPEKVKKLYTERKDNFLAILTTDGGLANPEEAAEELERLVQYGNDLAVIYIKHFAFNYDEDKKFMDRMSKCAQVHTITDPRDLIEIEIDYAKKYWGKIE